MPSRIKLPSQRLNSKRVHPAILPAGPEKTGPGTWRFTVWAPRRKTVDLDLPAPGHRAAMTKLSGGYFQAELSGLADGARYRFVLDGKTVRPDPASRHQPDGVHGSSALVDHHAFAWSDAGFIQPAPEQRVFYEIHIGTFTPEGTFDAAISRLPYLRDLGVTCLEIMPVAQFPGGRNWGYDGVYPFAPAEAYGGPDGLARLVDACHAHGLAAVLDVVYNHLGPEGNYTRDFGPYFTDRYRTPWGEAVNFDGPGSGPVRAFFIQNALYWLDTYHFDGLRLDAVHAIHDQEPLHFLRELSQNVAAFNREHGKRKFLVAESHANDPALITDLPAGGQGMEGVWTDDFHHAVHALLTGERRGYYADFGRREDLLAAINEGFAYSGQYSPFFGRSRGLPAGHLPAGRFVTFLQNHDQTGNRAHGDRLASLVSPEAARLATCLLLLSPGSPLLFMGEEWGETNPFLYFVSYHDIKLAKAVRRGRKREFAVFRWCGEPADPGVAATFAASKIDWEKPGRPPHAGLLAMYRELLGLRAAAPALHGGQRRLTRAWPLDGSRALAMERLGGGERYLCLFNAGPRRARVQVGISGWPGDWVKVFEAAEVHFGGPGATLPETFSPRLTLEPFAAAIYKREENSP
jgi:maltooligosyltrehalose trehalohydrolase